MLWKMGIILWKECIIDDILSLLGDKIMTEREWDQKLNIDTIGRDASVEDAYHHPYEPTPYSVLERLAESEYLCEDNIVVDYGCGRGRVGFFLSEKIGCQVVGV